MMCADRHIVLREVQVLRRRIKTRPPDKNLPARLNRLENRAKASIREKNRRRENKPRLKYNPDLPITSRKEEIIAAIQSHPVVIISGETGSGKTTQIPKFCLAAGRGIYGQIGCTQPRRIAATTVASRISEELGQVPGDAVGYKIRFRSRTGSRTFIKIMTDGILLSEIQRDPYLNQYDTLIVDEAHERSLNIDFILGILKSLLKQRNDLKVVITSATIDTQKFSEAFDHAPIIEVSGRMYPVSVRYMPETPPEGTGEETTYVEMAVRAVERLQRSDPWGDVLVFMPTEQGIRETCDLISGRGFRGVTVFPLYARLSAAEQKRIFHRLTGRKIIVATNIAETSITIPGIKYVIDTGLARISQYSPRSRTTALPVVPVSKSSADQRKGRCGRMQNGVCIRLFSEEDYDSRPLFTPPEILRANLAEVVLRMLALKLDNVSEFPFIDPPAPKSIQDGFDLLVELGAIKPKPAPKKSADRKGYSLTENGRLMAKIPIDPRLSRMLIEAQKEDCLNEMLIIASALSIQDPRERPLDSIHEADRAQAVFADPASDFITLLNIWNRYHDELRQEKSNRRLKSFCRMHFLSFNRMREWRDIHAQIKALLDEVRFTRRPGSRKPGPDPGAKAKGRAEKDSALYGAIHRSILSGFLSQIAEKKEKNLFKAARGREVVIFPGSGLFDRADRWVVAAEMVETSRLFFRTVANIDPRWLEDLGRELCKYTYLNPRWDINQGRVVASEQVSLYGLIIMPPRTVGYGPINPEEARDIFVGSALVSGRVRTPPAFMKHNQDRINEVKVMENRLRRRDLLVGDGFIFEFYRQRLPLISDLKSLEKFLKDKKNDAQLRLKTEDLFNYPPDRKELSLYPEILSLKKHRFPLSYNFDPGTADDGVTLNISSNLVPVIEADMVDWVVPGLLREKITALIRGLPKTYRTKLMPLNRTVDIILSEMPRGKTNLATALSMFISERLNHAIPASAWPLESLPDHLKMRLAVTDLKGNVIKAGRDKALLYQAVSEKIEPDEFESARLKWEKQGLTRWDFGDLPESITVAGRDKTPRVLYTGLEIDPAGGGKANLRLFQRRDDAHRSHLKGVRKLLGIYFAGELKFLKKALHLPARVRPLADYFGGAERFEKMLFEKIETTLFEKNIRTQEEFDAQAKIIAACLRADGQQKFNLALNTLTAYHEARTTLHGLKAANQASGPAVAFIENLQNELIRLVPDTFVALYDDDRLVHLPRYIKALAMRTERGLINLEKDQQKSEHLSGYTRSLKKLLQALTPLTSKEKRMRIEEFFWLLEEYKISLFAQELKTAFPVSKKRLDRKLVEIEKMV